MKTTEKTTETKATKAAVAKHLFLGVRTVRRLVEENKLPSSGTLDDYREAHIRQLREMAAGRAAKSGEVDLVLERALLARKQRERVEFELARKRGMFCDVEETCRQLKETFYVVKEIALTMPGKVADPCAMQPREIVLDFLQRGVNEMLLEMSDSAADEIARRAAEEAKQC
jgi:hypothetical protein